MSYTPVVLLVEEDIKDAQLVSRAIERRAMTRPLHVSRGEEAVLWVGLHACDVCLVDYRLPGIDGLETLVRLHQRKPDLPVIMMSDAKSEGVVVAAFRAGVADFVPKRHDFEEIVANLVQQHTQGLTAPGQGASARASAAADMPPELFQPTYQNRLRVIGRQLDLYGYRSISLLEVAGGFLVRAMMSGGRTPEALEFTDRDFPQAASNAFAARGKREQRHPGTPLLQAGYEDFLRALGHRLDRRTAEAVTVTELDSFIAVSGVERADGTSHTAMQPFQELLRPDDVAFLVDEAFQRRVKRGLGFRRVAK